MKYKVEYAGFAYVEADSANEAVEKFNDGEEIFDEREITAAVEVEDFTVAW